MRYCPEDFPGFRAPIESPSFLHKLGIADHPARIKTVRSSSSPKIDRPSIPRGRDYNLTGDVVVRETRNGVTKDLLSTANPVEYPTQYDLPLYCAYDATKAEMPIARDAAPAIPGR